MRVLCVTNHFCQYLKGDHIFDETQIAEVQASANRFNVVAIELPDRAPDESETPAT